MASMKTRAAFAGGKFLITHPQARVTRIVVRFVMRRVTKKLAGTTHVEAIPATRGSRLTTLAGAALVTGGVVFVVRRRARRARAASIDVTRAPFPPSATVAPETRDAPPVTPTASPAAEAVAASAPVTVADGDDDLVARVEAKLSDVVPGTDLKVEAVSGVVTLRGQVSDEDAESRAVRDAEQVEGVKAVQSELQTAGAEPESPSS